MSQLITQKDINQARQMYVVMSNDIIQRSTYSLKGMEHKVIRYLISKIKPSDRPYTEYEFDIKDFCRLCNYDTSSSGTYIRYVKDIIENIMTHTIQIPLADGSLYMTHWIQSCRIRPTDGSFMVQFDQHLSPLSFPQLSLCIPSSLTAPYLRSILYITYYGRKKGFEKNEKARVWCRNSSFSG